MILGRQRELGRLEELLAGLACGHGRTLVLRGDPGIGKSTMLEELAARAGAGMRVLWARGVETEAELAFAGLYDLLTPVVEHLGALPEPQSAALGAALALRPPAPGDRLAVCVATLGLLRAAAVKEPVLAIVDDVQWLDAASAECVLFAARRSGGALAFALAVRDPAPHLAVDGPEHETVRLGPLAGDAALELLARVAPGLAPPVAAALAEEAAGNPLALVELPALMAAGGEPRGLEQRGVEQRGLEPGSLEPGGLGPGGASVERRVVDAGEEGGGVARGRAGYAPGTRLGEAFAGRIAELDAAGRRALLVAAAHLGEDLRTVAAACRDAGTDVALLARAEEVGLVRLGAGRVTFGHPITRAAAYHAASPAERRRAHRALAGVVAGDQRAWHLAAAAVGPDERAATELERVADAAAARRGFAAAAAALERAARLSPDGGAAARRLLAAGEAASAAGAQDRALGLLQEASEVAPGRALRARAQHLRGRLLIWTGSPVEATSLLIAEAERAAKDDPALGALMLADAANGAVNINSDHRAEALARRAAALLDTAPTGTAPADGAPADGPSADGASADAADTAGADTAAADTAGADTANAGGEAGDDVRAAVLTTLGWVLLMRGKAVQARPVLERARGLAHDLDPFGPHWSWLNFFLRAHSLLGDLERAREESAAVCERAQAAGALATWSLGLNVLADAEFRLGDWDAADTASRTAIRVTADAGQPASQGIALTIRARLTGARGQERESREAAGAAQRIAESLGFHAGLRYVHGAYGFLELSLDRPEAAIAELETVRTLVAGSGMEEPTIVPWVPDLTEAYVRAGRADDARRMLETLDRQAEASGLVFAAAVAERCRGMLEDDFAPCFATALALHDRRPMPFERARTLLAYGRRLHRARRRAEARDRLREALAVFEPLGAEAWSEQTRHELRAAGARRRAPGDDTLTAQELRVADGVRRGLANREIAAELFLAPKTIEFHLSQIYRKLGTHSRSRLIALLVEAESGHPSPGTGARLETRDSPGAPEDPQT